MPFPAQKILKNRNVVQGLTCQASHGRDCKNAHDVYLTDNPVETPNRGPNRKLIHSVNFNPLSQKFVLLFRIVYDVRVMPMYMLLKGLYDFKQYMYRSYRISGKMMKKS